MSKKFLFPDGTYVEWANKECVNYVEPSRMVQVWVDHQPGLFNSGRIIRLSSLKKWSKVIDSSSLDIDENLKLEIIGKIRVFFDKENVSTEE